MRGCRARPHIAQTQCSLRHPLTSMAFVLGSMWTSCLPPSQEWDGRPCPVQWIRLALCTSLLLAYRSDGYGHAISRLDKLISSKGAYFPSSAFSHISLSFSAATPWCSDSIIPNLYQQACCNMDKANTCYSIGSSVVTVASLGFLWVFN